jgi:hypothetical protein
MARKTALLTLAGVALLGSLILSAFVDDVAAQGKLYQS